MSLISTYLRDTVHIQTTSVSGSDRPGTTTEMDLRCRLEEAAVRKEAIQGNSLVGNGQLLIHPDDRSRVDIGTKIRVGADVFSVNMVQAAKGWSNQYFRVWYS